MTNSHLSLLRSKLEEQRRYVDAWKQPSEPLLFETLRAIDRIFCGEHFLVSLADPDPATQIRGWGVNGALGRMMPNQLLSHNEFRLFESRSDTSEQADEFLFQAGALELGRRVESWVSDGLVETELSPANQARQVGVDRILAVRSRHPSSFSQMAFLEDLGWTSNFQVRADEDAEVELIEQHKALIPKLEASVRTFQGWGIQYVTDDEIDQHFLRCGQLYLRRMWGADLIGNEDKLGGHQYNEYLGVLAGLAARNERHLCYAHLLHKRHPELDIRNLLTTFAPWEGFVAGLSRLLGADTDYVQALLVCLTLAPTNVEAHTRGGDMTWAPIVRASSNFVLLPTYGIEINPFMFLLSDLRSRYPSDWDRHANGRETRWHSDLKLIFPEPRWQSSDGTVRLKADGRIVTDIDFLAFDRARNELALFQLKWQQPVGIDARAQRSAGKNLYSEGNKWIEAVDKWLSRFGIAELGTRSGFQLNTDTKIARFVVGRYRTGFAHGEEPDKRAVWVNWNQLMRVRLEHTNASLAELTGLIQVVHDEAARKHDVQSFAIPVRDLAVVLRPEAIQK